MLRMLSLCSGIGAIDLAAEMTRAIQVVGQVEINPFCNKVLAKHWSDVKRLLDIKEVRGDEFGSIDIVAGGIPCQPFSKAGKRGGTTDDRHLWPFAFAIIKVARPAWVVIENVDDFIHMALELVASDLESEGYEVQAYVLPACAIGAPHYRQRCIVVAHTQRMYGRQHNTTSMQRRWKTTPQQTRMGSLSVSHANSIQQRIQQEQESSCEDSPLFGHDGTLGPVVNASSSGQQECNIATITSEQGLDPWRTRAPGIGGQSQSRVCGGFDGLADWMDGSREWRWPALLGQLQEEWEPPRTIIDKLPNRSQRLEALGNAVVWQQIYPFFDFIAQWETSTSNREEVEG